MEFDAVGIAATRIELNPRFRSMEFAMPLNVAESVITTFTESEFPAIHDGK